MKIKMRTLASGPDGNLLPDESYDVPLQVSHDAAKDLVDGGYAIWVKAAAATVEQAPFSGDEVIETAELQVPEDAETADLPTSEAEAVEKAKPVKKNKSKEF